MSKSTVMTRKDMKEPDKFQVAAQQAATWVALRRKHVVVAGAVAVGALLAVAVFSALQARRAQEAGAAGADLLAAMGGEISSVPLPGLPGPFYPSEVARQKAVLAAAERVLADHAGSGAGLLARLAKGDAQLRLRDWDAAAVAYEKFLGEAPKGDSLRFGALEGVALAREGKGDLEGAAQAYERMGKEAPAFADRADLERARVLASAGKTEEAKKLLVGFAGAHKDSLLAAEAATRLGRLGAGK
jgi:tetratricopeptide (TPR) repeat protein